jgi:hypothetical protein
MNEANEEKEWDVYCLLRTQGFICLGRLLGYVKYWGEVTSGTCTVYPRLYLALHEDWAKREEWNEVTSGRNGMFTAYPRLYLGLHDELKGVRKVG